MNQTFSGLMRHFIPTHSISISSALLFSALFCSHDQSLISLKYEKKTVLQLIVRSAAHYP